MACSKDGTFAEYSAFIGHTSRGQRGERVADLKSLLSYMLAKVKITKRLCRRRNGMLFAVLGNASVDRISFQAVKADASHPD